MTKQIRLSKKLISQFRETLINLHIYSKEPQSRFKSMGISQDKAIDIALTNPEDLILSMLIIKCYLFNNQNDYTNLECYLIQKYAYDKTRPFKEIFKVED